jgi:hypothetical protein
VLTASNSLGLLDNLLTLSQNQLNVARVGHVRVDATVSAVCAAALLGGLVDLDVLDNQVASVETLGIGVGLGVLEQAEEELSRLDGPAGTGDTEGLALGGAANGTAVAAHGNGLALGHDVLEELDRALKLPAVDGLSGLASVLERNTEVGTAGAGRLGRLDLSRSVSDLVIEEKEKCQLLLSQNLTARSSRVSPNNIPKGRQSQIFNTDSIVSQ